MASTVKTGSHQAGATSESHSEVSKKRLEIRREPRIPTSHRIDILPCSSLKSDHWRLTSVEVVDCSPHGIGFIAQSPWNTGEQFLAKLDVGTLALVLYTVRHCTPIEGGRYRVGAEFTRFSASPLFLSDGSSVVKMLTSTTPEKN